MLGLRSEGSFPKPKVNYDKYIYDNSLIISDISDSCVCIICFDIMKNPVQCCEGHNFCKLCCMEWLQVRSQCPACNCAMSVDELKPNRGLEGVIRDYKIKCPTTIQYSDTENSRKRSLETTNNIDKKIPRVCNWSGKREMAASHLEKDCESYLVTCHHGDCKVVVEKGDFPAHEEVCNSIKCICKLCNHEFSPLDYKSHICDRPQVHTHTHTLSSCPSVSSPTRAFSRPGDESLELFMKSMTHDVNAWRRLCALAAGDSEEKNFALGYQMEVYMKSDAPNVIARDAAKAKSIYVSIRPWLDLQRETMGTKKGGGAGPMDSHVAYLTGMGTMWFTKKAKNKHTNEAFYFVKIAASLGHSGHSGHSGHKGHKGHPPARRMLAEFASQGFPRSEPKAQRLQWGFENLKSAAEAGYAVAQVEMAQYYDAKGDEEGDRQSFHWNMLAGSQGHAVAEKNLAYSYRTGCGCTMDLTEAKRYCKLFLQKGYK